MSVDSHRCRLTKPAPACCTKYLGSWDPKNAEALLRRAAAREDPLAAVALGNELGGERAIEALNT